MRKDDLFAAVKRRLDAVDAALETIPDEEAVNATALFPAWRPQEDYKQDYRLAWKDKLYRVVQPHTSQEGWEPDKVPALFAEIPKPGEIEVWRQPTGAQDAYMTGDKVHYPAIEDPVYINEVDYNVYAPDVYGWKKVQ